MDASRPRGFARAGMQAPADSSRDADPAASLLFLRGKNYGAWGQPPGGHAAHRVRAALPRADRRRPPAHLRHHFLSKPVASISQRTSEEAKRQPARREGSLSHALKQAKWCICAT